MDARGQAEPTAPGPALRAGGGPASFLLPRALALDFTAAGVAVFIREDDEDGESWVERGAALLDEPSFEERARGLLTVAGHRGLAGSPTWLWLPPEQVLVLEFEADAPAARDDRAAAEIAAAALEMPAEALLLARSRADTDGRVTVLAALRQSADEATGHARSWGFLPGPVSTRTATVAFAPGFAVFAPVAPVRPEDTPVPRRPGVPPAASASARSGWRRAGLAVAVGAAAVALAFLGVALIGPPERPAAVVDGDGALTSAASHTAPRVPRVDPLISASDAEPGPMPLPRLATPAVTSEERAPARPSDMAVPRAGAPHQLAEGAGAGTPLLASPVAGATVAPRPIGVPDRPGQPALSGAAGSPQRIRQALVSTDPPPEIAPEITAERRRDVALAEPVPLVAFTTPAALPALDDLRGGLRLEPPVRLAPPSLPGLRIAPDLELGPSPLRSAPPSGPRPPALAPPRPGLRRADLAQPEPGRVADLAWLTPPRPRAELDLAVETIVGGPAGAATAPGPLIAAARPLARPDAPGLAAAEGIDAQDYTGRSLAVDAGPGSPLPPIRPADAPAADEAALVGLYPLPPTRPEVAPVPQRARTDSLAALPTIRSVTPPARQAARAVSGGPTTSALLGVGEPVLIGVIERQSSRDGLVRLPDGAVRRVSVGDRIDGWLVSRIDREALNLTRPGRVARLTLIASP